MSAIAVAAGLLADQVAGEPPQAVHPVALFGAAMVGVERRTYRDSRAAGVAHLSVGIAIGAACGLVVRKVVGPRCGTAAMVALCTAGRMLDREAAAVETLLACGDLPAARTRIRSLVGRRTDSLGEAELSRATIESVAENAVDAVTASVFWGFVGGAVGVAVHRAVNTLDAMVGHRSARYSRFGWASARLDDAMNYVPARLTAVAVAAAAPRRARCVAAIVRRDAARHPSPNGGVVEAAFAAALGVRLGGVNRYADGDADEVEDRGTLGDGPPPTVADIGRAIRLRRRVTALVVLVPAVAEGAVWTWRRSFGRARRGSSPPRATRPLVRGG